jgi:beta-phosphoglucomutase
MEKCRAILFDFDGVIGKTLEDSCRAWKQACAESGITFDPEDFYLHEGMKSAEYARRLLERNDRDPAEAYKLVARKDELYRASNEFSFYPGIEKLVVQLQQGGVRVGVVSGGSRQRLLSGGSGDLLRRCDTVVTGDDLSEGKPSPEGYIRAAEGLGFSPKECIVVENAPLGIQAAKSAGMTCVGVCSTLSSDHLTGADIVLTGHSELIEWFELQRGDFLGAV